MTTTQWRLDWPASQGLRLAHAGLKAAPEDFQVDEILGFPGFPEHAESDVGPMEVSGEGEHLCLRLEKRGDNTDYVARALARMSGCQPHDIGLCGLKDRHAVTRQWFSVYRPGKMDDGAFLDEVRQHWTVISAHRFARKLRRGEHQANRFCITLTDVEGDRLAINAGLGRIRREGCPNYFGAQRFGHDGNNLFQAVRMKPGRQRGKNSRDGLYFSAARSWLFNEVLAERLALGNWSTALDGEPLSGEVTGPMWGDGGTTATGQQETLERSVVERHPEMAAVFSQTRMKPERRSLVLLPVEFEWQWATLDRLTLSFELRPGQFATTVLMDLFETADQSRPSGLAAEQ
ncbi:tRNA pseudouridine(13) synthase TruD [Marinobacter caseinilyticus]|uniref:tRNA pseudouridine(13) synthase TruD n=1 Tax=Marinobacter caseinilyticus TaxID=2692195 RepID=UPI00140A0B74|nr:tRNA pseudouridine(13) synthase TruD [Marinobacter caseinilyticus]